MGGKAFKDHDPPIDTPRMSKDVYKTILDRVRIVLRNCYGRVETAIEAPEKNDYGDIDILVSNPLDRQHDPAHNADALENLSLALDSIKYKHEENSPSHFYAIPWPDNGDRYAILDIQYNESEEKQDWALFQNAHGDMCNIFGSMIRPLKLVINDKGLYITIPELEALGAAKQDRLVLLTADPNIVLEFLGVDKERYWKPFDTVQDMFEYSATSRFSRVVRKPSPGPQDTSSPLTEEQATSARTDTVIDKKDAEKISHRPNFAKWKTEFRPQCLADGRFSEQGYTEETARAEAFKAFEGVEQEYLGRLRSWKLDDQRRRIKKVIRETVPKEGVKSHIRSAAVHSYDAIVLKNTVPKYVTVPEYVRPGQDGFWDLDMLKEWIMKSWEEVSSDAIREHDEQK